jgi:hypothetical protein
MKSVDSARKCSIMQQEATNSRHCAILPTGSNRASTTPVVCCCRLPWKTPW